MPNCLMFAHVKFASLAGIISQISGVSYLEKIAYYKGFQCKTSCVLQAVIASFASSFINSGYGGYFNFSSVYVNWYSCCGLSALRQILNSPS